MSHRAERQQEWAVFWCSLLGPLLSGDIAPKEAAGFLAELAERKCHFPDGEFRKPSRATLWRKWKQYRQGGFDALQRRRRKDRGQARKPSADMIDKAIETIPKPARRRGYVTKWAARSCATWTYNNSSPTS